MVPSGAAVHLCSALTYGQRGESRGAPWTCPLLSYSRPLSWSDGQLLLLHCLCGAPLDAPGGCRGGSTLRTLCSEQCRGLLCCRPEAAPKGPGSPGSSPKPHVSLAPQDCHRAEGVPWGFPWRPQGLILPGSGLLNSHPPLSPLAVSHPLTLIRNLVCLAGALALRFSPITQAFLAPLTTASL